MKGPMKITNSCDLKLFMYPCKWYKNISILNWVNDDVHVDTCLIVLQFLGIYPWITFGHLENSQHDKQQMETVRSTAAAASLQIYFYSK